MILLMGIAGSGKGTQGQLLAKKYNLHIVAMGDILRRYANDKQRAQMLSGELLGDDEIIQIVDRVLQEIPEGKEALLDGFPRTIKQAQWLIAQVQAERFKVDLAIHLIASHDSVRERLLKRARIDDKSSSIEARFDEYERSTQPVLKWLKTHGIKVVAVDAERSIETVNADLVNLLDSA